VVDAELDGVPQQLDHALAIGGIPQVEWTGAGEALGPNPIRLTGRSPMTQLPAAAASASLVGTGGA